MQQVQNTTAAFVLTKYTEIEDDLGGKKTGRLSHWKLYVNLPFAGQGNQQKATLKL